MVQRYKMVSSSKLLFANGYDLGRPTVSYAVAAVYEAGDVEVMIDSIMHAHADQEGRRIAQRTQRPRFVGKSHSLACQFLFVKSGAQRRQ